MKKIAVLAFVLVSTFTMAQRIKVVSGDASVLKGQEKVNVEFDYSKLTLMKDELPEERYVAERKADLNEKNAGVGDKWEKEWNGAKKLIWEEKFLALMQKYCTEKKGIDFETGHTGTKYTLVVEVLWIYPGWDVYVQKQPAKMTCNLKIVETDNKGNVVFEMSAKDAPGAQFGSQFNNETRIGESFAKCGKTFAGYLVKKVL